MSVRFIYLNMTLQTDDVKKLFPYLKVGPTENVKSGGCRKPQCGEDLPHQQVLQTLKHNLQYEEW